MKETYLSVVLTRPDVTVENVRYLDETFSKIVRLHEIILVQTGSFSLDLSQEEFHGAVTILRLNGLPSESRMRRSGLGRAAGDFIFEWRGNAEVFSADIATDYFGEIADQIELYEIQGKVSNLEKFNLNILNLLRDPLLPIRKSIGTFYSRNMLNQIMTKSASESEIDLIIADVPVWQRGHRTINADYSNFRNRSHFLELLIRGTTFGAAIPFSLAGGSAAIAVGAIFYALITFLIFGKTPQGWTTLMIVIGLGQSSILILLGFIWSKLNSIHNSLSGSGDSTSGWVVHPPKS